MIEILHFRSEMSPDKDLDTRKVIMTINQFRMILSDLQRIRETLLWYYYPPRFFFLSLQKSSGHIYLSQSVKCHVALVAVTQNKRKIDTKSEILEICCFAPVQVSTYARYCLKVDKALKSKKKSRLILKFPIPIENFYVDS